VGLWLLRAVCICVEVSRFSKIPDGLQPTSLLGFHKLNEDFGSGGFIDSFALRLTYVRAPVDLQRTQPLSLLRLSEGLVHLVTLRSGSTTCLPLPWGIPRERSAASRRLPALPYIISPPVCSNTPPHSPLCKHLGHLVTDNSTFLA